MNTSFEFTGGFLDFFNPYSVLVGFTAIAIFSMHGAIFLFMKTEGALHDSLKKWINPSILIFAVLYLTTTIFTAYALPWMVEPMKRYPILFIFPLIAAIAIVNIPILVRKHKDGYTFILSCIAIAFLLITSFIGVYPNLIRSSVNTAVNSITLFNASSSDFTLKVLLIIAAIGVPLVFAYGIWVYHIFRGKVKLDETSY